MRTRSLMTGVSTSLIVAGLLSPCSSRAAQPTADCVTLVARQVRETDRSKAMELQREVQADRVAAAMVDALGQKLKLGPSWKAGNPFWHEAGRFLDSFERRFGVPPSLKALSRAAHQEVAEATAAKEEPKLSADREEWRRFGQHYASAMKRLPPADPRVEEKASGEAAAKMMAKNQQAFVDIVRRLKAVAGK